MIKLRNILLISASHLYNWTFLLEFITISTTMVWIEILRRFSLCFYVHAT